MKKQVVKKSLFTRIGEIGNLYLKEILFEFEKEPIIFVCENDKEDLFFCICTDSIIEYTWLVTKVNINFWNRIKKGEILINEALKQSDNMIFLIKKNRNDFTYKKYRFSDIPEEELPDNVNVKSE